MSDNKVVHCLSCGEEFQQTRYWQRYCSMECRRALAKAKRTFYCPKCGEKITL